jgi:hypothetical protein
MNIEVGPNKDRAAEQQAKVTRSLSLAEYVSELQRHGLRVLPGSAGTFWLKYESWGWLRMPTFAANQPEREEMRRVLSGLSAFAGYVVEPSIDCPANAYLYLCEDQSYSLDKLSSAGRRDVRRAGRNLRLSFLEWSDVWQYGLQAYTDTRKRVGLSDGTAENFNSRFNRSSSNAACQVVGAWEGDNLAAFMTLAVIDDWVEIQGSFSCDRQLRLCPNNGLADFVLSHFLGGRRCRTVSYGLSSIQEADRAGLHAYKIRVGFQPRPVYRAFVLNPLVAPFAHPISLKAMHALLYFHPGNRKIRKAAGLLASVLHHKK